jgi:c-di-GMP-binding flagellar brake protein YcgR
VSNSDQRKVFSWKRPVLTDKRAAIRLTASGRKWDVRLVGQISKTRFLVTHPTDDGMLVFVKEGETFGVSNFDGAFLSTFDSTVLRVILGESPGLEFSLPPPEQRRREIVRKLRRAGVTIPCAVRYGSGENQFRAGFTGDLSVRGMQVAIESPLPDGTTELDVSVRLMVLGSAMTVQVKAVIRSTTKDHRPDFPATLLGLEFLDLDPGNQLAISQYVGEKLLAEQDDVFGMVR